MLRITYEELVSKVKYDPDTGVFTWRERPRSVFNSDHQFNAWNANYAGKRAGYISQRKTGYKNRAIRFGDRLIGEHRLAWLYMTKEHPPKQIDHINRDGTDNRWKNLRDGTNVNKKNHSKHKNNTSGISGVSWSRDAGKWRAYVMVDRKQIHLGMHESKMAAAKAVSDARKRYGFEPGHCSSLAPYVDE